MSSSERQVLQECLNRLAEAAFEGIVIHEKGRILDANNVLARMFGYELSDLRGRSVLKLVAPQSRALVWAQIQAQAADPYEVTCLKKDGVIFPVEVRGKPFPYDGRMARVAAVRDRTRRKQMENDLRLARRQLALSREASQQRLAHELHDGPIQQLLGLSYRLLEAKDAIREGQTAPTDILSTLDSIWQGTVSIVSQLRNLMFEFRPPELYEVGLAEALEGFVRSLLRASEPHSIGIKVDVTLDESALPEEIRINLFRIGQEALRNAVQHASATQIELKLYEVGEDVWLEVRDDGQGFTAPGSWSQLTQAHSFGLVTMMERAEVIGGRLKLLSQPGEGTILVARIPLNLGEMNYDDQDN